MSSKKKSRPSSPAALYVYCIGDASQLRGALEGDLPEPVEPGAGFEPVAFDDLAAVTSRVPLADYGEEAIGDRLADPSWTAQRVMRHEVVLEHLASRAAIVPLRLGTIFLDQSRVEAMLRERYDELRNLVGKLEGRDEWSLIVYCDRDRLAEKMPEYSTKVRELAAQADSASKGQAYLLRRKIDSLRGDEVRAAIKRAVSDVETRLKAVSEDLRPLGLGRRGPDADGAVAKLTLLVRRAAFSEFRAVAEQLAAEYREIGFRLELVGPLPAYNFVRIDRME